MTSADGIDGAVMAGRKRLTRWNAGLGGACLLLALWLGVVGGVYPHTPGPDAVPAAAQHAGPTPAETTASPPTTASTVRQPSAEPSTPDSELTRTAVAQSATGASRPAAAPPGRNLASAPGGARAAGGLPRVVRMAVPDWDSLPFTDYNDGRARGFSIELVQQILAERGIELQFVRTSRTEDTFKALCEGRIELAANLLLTPQRTRCVAYTDPVMQMSLYAVKRRDDTRMLSEDNLKRMRMAVPRAMLEHIRNRERFAQTEVVPVANIREGLRLIDQGQADVLFEAPYVIEWYLQRGSYPNLELIPTVQIPPSMQQRDMYMLYATPHAQLPLLKLIDEGIKRDPARVERLRAQWLHRDFRRVRPSTELTGVQREWLAQLPPLRMALADNAAPLSSRDNDGRAVGIVPDYASIAQDRLGLRFSPRIVNGNRGVIIALATGAADLGVVPIGSVPGESEHWVYSQPIEHIPMVIVTRQDASASIGLESLAGKRVSVALLHLTGRAVAKAAPDANIVGVNTEAEGLKLLMAGKVDAHVGNLAVIDRVINSQYTAGELQVSPSGHDLDLAFVADRRLAPLIAMIDQQLESVSQPERQRIHDHWISAKYNYGVAWSKVIAIVAVALLVIGLIAAGYLRLRQESRRREAADSKLREVAGNLPGVVFKAQHDRDGTIRFPYLTGRPELLFGVEAERIVADAQALFSRIHPGDLARLQVAITAAVRSLSEFNADFRVLLDGGEQHWVRVSALPRPMQPKQGRSESGYTGYFVDVTHAHVQATALEAAKEQAEAATRAKSSFLATMSHEIRTPMGGMVGMLELLEQSPLDDDQQVLLGHMQDSARALQGILDDILDVSKIEAGHLRIEHAPLQPRVLADTVAMHATTICRKKGLRLDVRIDAAVARFYLGDAMRLRQVLLNLLGNSVKFTEHGGVWLHLRVPVDAGPSAPLPEPSRADALAWLEIEVGDTGIGMDATQVAWVFEPFQQGDDSTSHRYGGTGLGLSICRSLIELMGGAIRIDSRLGQGTRVIATVPLGLVEASGAESAGLRVAVTLSDPCRADALRQLLIAMGHEPVGMEYGSDLLFTDGEVRDTVRVVRSPGSEQAADYVIDVNPLLHLHVVRACAWARDPHGAPRESGPRDARERSQPAPPRAGRILVVEDNTVNRELIRRQLLQLGYVCDLCNEGRSALLTLQNRRHDLLLTDCQMPLMDGYTLAREIRADERRRGLRRLPIVAITASALPEQVDLCMAAGMDGYLIKPVHLSELRETLEQWLPATEEARGGDDAADAPGPARPAARDALVQPESVPQALRAVLPLLLSELPKDRARIAQAVAAGSASAVAAAVHRVIGGIALYDGDIASDGQRLEVRLASETVPELRDEIDAFDRRLGALHDRLQAALLESG